MNPQVTVTRRNTLLVGTTLAASFALGTAIAAFSAHASAQTAPMQMTAEQIQEEQAYAAGVQVALWGRPLVDYVHTSAAGLKAKGIGLNYLRKFPNLKTAADKFVNTPNNVSIDAYASADLTNEPVVLRVPPINEKRWYIVQIGDIYDQVVYNVGAAKGLNQGCSSSLAPTIMGRFLLE